MSYLSVESGNPWNRRATEVPSRNGATDATLAPCRLPETRDKGFSATESAIASGFPPDRHEAHAPGGKEIHPDVLMP